MEYSSDIDYADDNWVPGEYVMTPEIVSAWIIPYGKGPG